MSQFPPQRPSFVFLDAAGRRWPRLRLRLFVLACLAGCAGVAFLAAVWVRPAVRPSAGAHSLKNQLKADAGLLARLPVDRAEPTWKNHVAAAAPAPDPGEVKEPGPARRGVRLGFYVDWDPNSMVSLRQHAEELTHLAPEWLSMEGPGAKLVVQSDPALSAFCKEHRLRVLPILSNTSNDELQPEAVENLAYGSSVVRARFIEELVEQLGELDAGGVLVQWHGLDPAYRDEYTGLVTEMAQALHEVNKELWFAMSMSAEIETFDITALRASVDRFVALMVDERSEAEAPGALASQSWVEGWLRVLKERGHADRWVVGLGSYAVDWNTTRTEAQTISFRDAMSRASYAGVEATGGVEIAAPDYNGRYAYSEPRGEHVVSFLDAISFHNQLLALRRAGFGGVAVSRLGLEDPQIWDVLRRVEPADESFAQSLGQLRADTTITHVGRGEIVSADNAQDDGERQVRVGSDGLLSASYKEFPTFPVLAHAGAVEAHQVVLTFDDGPDPDWTPQVLDILKAHGVKAVFFVVGKNVQDNPDLLARIAAEGHEIGNHTYTHSNLAEMPQWRMRLELDATERLIESVTGYSTILFRPPYNADSNPSTIEETAPLEFAEKELGYTVVLERIDPQDWAQPGAAEILRRVKQQRNGGSIILLHDAGGDREQTLEALPLILAWLKERGDKVVSLSELLKIPREELMPMVQSGAQPAVRAIADTGFRLWHWVVESLWAFMIFATVLVVIRSLLIAWLAWRQRQTEGQTVVGIPLPAVSVLIAAFNEEKIIGKTLESVLASEYGGVMEVIVVDDGSSDGTSEVVAAIAARDSRVRGSRQANAGKSAALQRAMAQASHPVLVFLDADTLLDSQAILRLVEPMLLNPLVGAVSGNARVGNVHSFLTRCQRLEYICGFNLDRRAYTLWDCVTVVPGAISALRRSAVEAAGGFSHDTLAEDTDMTLTLHRLGYRIRYASRAIAWTEAPEKWRDLAKQRFRWAFGTMQCLWKHRDLLWNPRFRALAFFSLPSAWFFQVFLVAITPLADAILLYSIVVGYSAPIWHYFAIFLAMDLFLTGLACWLEREPLRRAWLIIPMRTVYRWLLAWVIWRAILRALKGVMVGWGKLDRTANVPSPV